jgi:formylglycine-generating enzyme required for sulfatase activity
MTVSPHECRGFRLPTEAEWEVAARAGTSTATPAGDLGPADLGCPAESPVLDDHAWYCGNSDGTTHEVGTTEPNRWGLYDMLGNVAEWCHDVYVEHPPGDETDPFGPEPFEGSLYAHRGGAWNAPAERTRAAERAGAGSAEALFVGIRLVRTVD